MKKIILLSLCFLLACAFSQKENGVKEIEVTQTAVKNSESISGLLKIENGCRILSWEIHVNVNSRPIEVDGTGDKFSPESRAVLISSKEGKSYVDVKLECTNEKGSKSKSTKNFILKIVN